MSDGYWRLSTKEEKELVSYWVKRVRNKDGLFQLCCFWVVLIVGIVLAIILKSERFAIIIGFSVVVVPAVIVFTIIFLVFQENYKMALKGDFRIVDVKVVDLKAVNFWNSNRLIEVSYIYDTEIKIKTLMRFSATSLYTDVGDSGYAILFQGEKFPWSREMYIPKKKPYEKKKKRIDDSDK